MLGAQSAVSATKTLVWVPQVPDEERVDRHEIASVMGLDKAFAELGAAFKCLDLLARQREGSAEAFSSRSKRS